MSARNMALSVAREQYRQQHFAGAPRLSTPSTLLDALMYMWPTQRTSQEGVWSCTCMAVSFVLEWTEGEEITPADAATLTNCLDIVRTGLRDFAVERFYVDLAMLILMEGKPRADKTLHMFSVRVPSEPIECAASNVCVCFLSARSRRPTSSAGSATASRCPCR